MLVKLYLEFGVLLRVELSHLLAEDDGSDDLLDLRLVHDGAEPTVHVAVRLSETRKTTNYKKIDKTPKIRISKI